MAAQQLIVFALVLGCSLYALWMLMPAVARRVVAKGLVHLPLGSKLNTVFKRAAAPGSASGCDCSGCDKVVDVKSKAAVQVVRFHPRTRN